jgi:hypothetical protein|tara:strand:+ start:428 stop:535 length:108 start_codon:yes stop_codon:yes gene_type:complete
MIGVNYYIDFIKGTPTFVYGGVETGVWKDHKLAKN